MAYWNPFYFLHTRSLALAALWVCSISAFLLTPKCSNRCSKQSVFFLGLVFAIYDFLKDCIKKANGSQNQVIIWHSHYTLKQTWILLKYFPKVKEIWEQFRTSALILFRKGDATLAMEGACRQKQPWSLTPTLWGTVSCSPWKLSLLQNDSMQIKKKKKNYLKCIAANILWVLCLVLLYFEMHGKVSLFWVSVLLYES